MDIPDPVTAVQRQLDREIQLVADAIAMVASGGSPRVTVAGLQLGDAVLGPAEQLARQAGVRIVPQWTADESGVDISVEPVG
jgi:3-dehydroquinate synthase class II